MGLILDNPQSISFNHPNFGSERVSVSLNFIDGSSGSLALVADRDGERVGYVQLEFSDSGQVKVRIDEGPDNVFFAEVV